jgi:RNA polymerase sigma-70 factor, ECF subfamily
LAENSDKIWLEALRDGDEKALQQLFDQHYPLLIGDIYRVLPDEDTCKDLAQEVFVELWRKRADLEIHTSLRAYLRRAAVNRALNHLKVQRRTVLEDSESFAEAPDDTLQETAMRENREHMEQALHAAIETLPEKCRAVFALSRFENLSHKEIAERLGISVKTIENQITKAMKVLREALTVLAVLSPVVISALKWYTLR